MGKIHTAGPNKAIIVCGRGGQRKKKVVVGGWVYAPPLICNIQYLSLTLVPVTIHCRDVITLEEVPLNVTGIGHFKIINSSDCLLLAAEHFLGRNINTIEISVLQALERHLRAILGTLTVEEIVRKEEKIISLVCEKASVEVANVGLQIVSFVIKEIYDNLGYLKSLGLKKIAEVKRDGIVGVAIAERDAGIKENESEKESFRAKYKALSNIVVYSRQYYFKKYSFDENVNRAKAELESTYQLAKAKLRYKTCLKDLNDKVIEHLKFTEIIEQKEVEHINRELIEVEKVLPQVEDNKRLTTSEVQIAEVIQKVISGRKCNKGEVQADIKKVIYLMEALLYVSEKGLCI